MKLRNISIFAAVALLAACSSNDEAATTTDGSGAVQQETSVQPVNQPSDVDSRALETQQLAEDSEAWFVQNVGDRVTFGYDSYSLSDESRRTLELQAAYLKKHAGKAVLIEGHCDERGTREYNFALGERRANAVRDYLLALGVEPGRIATRSYGKERPVKLGHNEESWAANRRGVTTFR